MILKIGYYLLYLIFYNVKYTPYMVGSRQPIFFCYRECLKLDI